MDGLDGVVDSRNENTYEPCTARTCRWISFQHGGDGETKRRLLHMSVPKARFYPLWFILHCG